MLMITRMICCALAGLAVAGAVGGGGAQADPVAVPLDGQTVLNGVAVGCTGIGQTKLDPKWQSYPVRIEFADAQSAYLADVVATISGADGRPMLEAGCAGPWLLFKLPPGHYRVEGRLTGSDARPQTAGFAAPSKGQTRIVLHFPGA